MSTCESHLCAMDGHDSSGSEEISDSEIDNFLLNKDLVESALAAAPRQEFLFSTQNMSMPTNLQDFGCLEAETQERLQALLHAAGISKMTNEGRSFGDPELLKRLTSSVSSALDEAAAALTRMKSDDKNLDEQTTNALASELTAAGVPSCATTPNGEEGESLLSLACSAGYYELCQVLLAMRTNVEDRGSKNDCTPLMEAASAGHADIVKLLIAHGADMNAQSSTGNTPLMYACAGGHEEVVRVLLKAGADVYLHNQNGHTPLMEAASAGHVGIAKQLVEHGAYNHDFKVGLDSPLTLASYKGHLDMVSYLLKAGHEKQNNGRQEELHTALMEASIDGHVDVARLLFEAGAQVNLPTDSFESPLTLAACGGHTELALLLLERGANLEEPNDDGYTPLMEAARDGHDEMVALLIEWGACINAQTEETGETALTLACCGGHTEVAALLLDNGADVELGANTPLMEAAQEGRVGMVRYLLKHAASVNACTASGDTPLTYAAENGHTDVCAALLDAGADVERPADGGRTPLMKACRAGHFCTVQFLLSKGADTEKTTTGSEHSALSQACSGGHLTVVELLLQHGADLNKKLKDGGTCIMEAAKGGHTSVVHLLLDWPNVVVSQTPSTPPTLPPCCGDVTDGSSTGGVLPSCAEITVATPTTEHSMASGPIRQEIVCDSTTPQAATGGSIVPQAGEIAAAPQAALEDAQTRASVGPFDMLQQQVVGGGRVEGSALAAVFSASMSTADSTGSTTPTFAPARFLQTPVTLANVLPHFLSSGGSHSNIASNKPIDEQTQAASGVLLETGGDVFTPPLLIPKNDPKSKPAVDISSQFIDASALVFSHTENTILKQSSEKLSFGERQNLRELLHAQVQETAAQFINSSFTDNQMRQAPAKANNRKSPGGGVVQPTVEALGCAEGSLPSFASCPDLLSDNHLRVLQWYDQVRHAFEQKDDKSFRKLMSASFELASSPMTSSSMTSLFKAIPIVSTVAPPAAKLADATLSALTTTSSDPKNNATAAEEASSSPKENATLSDDTQRQQLQEGASAFRSLETTAAVTPLPSLEELEKAPGFVRQLETKPPKGRGRRVYEHNDYPAQQIPGDPHAFSGSSTQLPSCAFSGAPLGQPPGQLTQQQQHMLTVQYLLSLDPSQLQFLNQQFNLAALSQNFQFQAQQQHQQSNSPGSPFAAAFHCHLTANVPASVVVGGGAGVGAVDPNAAAVALASFYQSAAAAAAVQQGLLTPTGGSSAGNGPFCNDGDTSTATFDVLVGSSAGTPLPPSTLGANFYVPIPVRPSSNNTTNATIALPVIAHTPAGADPSLTQNPRSSITVDDQSSTFLSNLATNVGRFLSSSIDAPTAPSFGGSFQNPVPSSFGSSDPSGVAKATQTSTTPSSDAAPASQPPLLPPATNIAGSFAAGRLATPQPPKAGAAIAGVDLNTQTDSNHDTALTLACAGGHADLVLLLLNRGANLEHQDKKGFTPLILASTAGHSNVVELLLQYGANPEAQSERTKDTALSLACSSGKKDVVELLLKKNVNREHRNVSDYTPLSLASSGGYTDIINLLLQYGAEINSRTGSKLGISPLMLASMNGHVQAVKLLLEKSADINAQIETNRNTALTLACFQGRHEVVKLLLHYGANVEHRAKTGLTPLMEAASGGYVEVGRILLDYGADPNSAPVPSSRDTALTIAADKGHTKFVDLLLQNGAQLDCKTKKGCTALWLAGHGGFADVVQALVKSGACPDAQDNRKVSPLMAAFRKSHLKVVKYLVRHVQQFPSDTECTRYLTTVTDKEILTKCKQCMEIILTAKDRQAQEANKAAAVLLQELENEQQLAETRRMAKLRQKEKKKAKRKAKKAVVSKNDDLSDGEKADDKENMDEDDEDEKPEKLGDTAIVASLLGNRPPSSRGASTVSSSPDASADRLKQRNIGGKFTVAPPINDDDVSDPYAADTFDGIEGVGRRSMRVPSNGDAYVASNDCTPLASFTETLPTTIADFVERRAAKRSAAGGTAALMAATLPCDDAARRRRRPRRGRPQAETASDHSSVGAGNANSMGLVASVFGSSEWQQHRQIREALKGRICGEADSAFADLPSNSSLPLASGASKMLLKLRRACPPHPTPLITGTIPSLTSMVCSSAVASISTTTAAPSARHAAHAPSTTTTSAALSSTGAGHQPTPWVLSSTTRSRADDCVSMWRDAKRQPQRVYVSSSSIARVIGRGGGNINAIREASAAHIEVEKQQKGQTDRLITIRGSSDAIKQAILMINGLINDPDVPVQEIVSKVKSRDCKALEFYSKSSANVSFRNDLLLPDVTSFPKGGVAKSTGHTSVKADHHAKDTATSEYSNSFADVPLWQSSTTAVKSKQPSKMAALFPKNIPTPTVLCNNAAKCLPTAQNKPTMAQSDYSPFSTPNVWLNRAAAAAAAAAAAHISTSTAAPHKAPLLNFAVVTASKPALATSMSSGVDVPSSLASASSSSMAATLFADDPLVNKAPGYRKAATTLGALRDSANPHDSASHKLLDLKGVPLAQAMPTVHSAMSSSPPRDLSTNQSDRTASTNASPASTNSSLSMQAPPSTVVEVIKIMSALDGGLGSGGDSGVGDERGGMDVAEEDSVAKRLTTLLLQHSPLATSAAVVDAGSTFLGGASVAGINGANFDAEGRRSAGSLGAYFSPITLPRPASAMDTVKTTVSKPSSNTTCYTTYVGQTPMPPISASDASSVQNFLLPTPIGGERRSKTNLTAVLTPGSNLFDLNSTQNLFQQEQESWECADSDWLSNFSGLSANLAQLQALQQQQDNDVLANLHAPPNVDFDPNPYGSCNGICGPYDQPPRQSIGSDQSVQLSNGPTSARHQATPAGLFAEPPGFYGNHSSWAPAQFNKCGNMGYLTNVGQQPSATTNFSGAAPGTAPYYHQQRSEMSLGGQQAPSRGPFIPHYRQQQQPFCGPPQQPTGQSMGFCGSSDPWASVAPSFGQPPPPPQAPWKFANGLALGPNSMPLMGLNGPAVGSNGSSAGFLNGPVVGGQSMVGSDFAPQLSSFGASGRVMGDTAAAPGCFYPPGNSNLLQQQPTNIANLFHNPPPQASRMRPSSATALATGQPPAGVQHGWSGWN